MTAVPAIGHNNPPAFDAYSMALDDAFATAKDFLDGSPIETQGQADAVGRIVGEVKRIKKDADLARKEEKRPHDEAAAAVQAKWSPLIDRADTIVKAAQAPLTAYLNKLADEQREAERIAREEAARKAQEAIAAQRASAGSVDAVDAAKALQKEADAAHKAAKRAGREKAHVAGMDRAIGLRTYWRHEITDRRELLKWIMNNDVPALEAFTDEYARTAVAGGVRWLPGVTITEEKRVA
jgi:hypothetical protein